MPLPPDEDNLRYRQLVAETQDNKIGELIKGELKLGLPLFIGIGLDAFAIWAYGFIPGAKEMPWVAIEAGAGIIGTGLITYAIIKIRELEIERKSLSKKLKRNVKQFRAGVRKLSRDAEVMDEDKIGPKDTSKWN